MNPRKPLANWQQFAQPSNRGGFGFAKGPAVSDVGQANDASCSFVQDHRDCYPFPSNWPGRTKVRPFFCVPMRRVSADPCGARGFGFANRLNVVDLSSTITNDKGRTTCAKQSFSFPFWPCRLPVACRIPVRGHLLVPRWARSLPTSPITALRPARSSVALQALRRAASIWGCLPAIDLIVAPAGRHSITDGHPGVTPGWPFLFCR